MGNVKNKKYAIAVAAMIASLNFFEAALKREQDDILDDLVANEMITLRQSEEKQQEKHNT